MFEKLTKFKVTGLDSGNSRHSQYGDGHRAESVNAPIQTRRKSLLRSHPFGFSVSTINPSLLAKNNQNKTMTKENNQRTTPLR